MDGAQVLLLLLPKDFVVAGRWGMVVAGAWREPAKIHDFEARAEVMGLKLARDLREHGTVLLSTGDNLSAVCACETGRAVSRDLLSQCRQAASLQLACEIRWRQRHVDTKRNVADRMSRAADRKEIKKGCARRGELGTCLARRPSSTLQSGDGRETKTATDATSAGAKRCGEGDAPADHLPGSPGPCSSPSAVASLAVLADSHSSGSQRRFVLELFAGCSRITACCLEACLSACCSLEFGFGKWHDLTDRRVQRIIVNWVSSGRIWLLHMGTPCTRWSGARTGVHEPAGGLACAAFTARLVRLCKRHKVIFAIENPKTSKLFGWPPLSRAIRQAGGFIFHHPQCAYGTPYQKWTSIATNGAGFTAMQRDCDRKSHSERLQGRVQLRDGFWHWRTSLASAYPPRLCRAYAACAAAMAPAGCRSKSRSIAQTWERELAAPVGETFTGRPAPRCPQRYRLPWLGYLKEWGGSPAAKRVAQGSRGREVPARAGRPPDELRREDRPPRATCSGDRCGPRLGRGTLPLQARWTSSRLRTGARAGLQHG